jgi:hypothetical protein
LVYVEVVMSERIVHVIDRRGYVLMGDSRGIVTPYEKRHEVWEWAQKNNIEIEYQGSLDRKDLWYVKNDRHRAWFMLRWS